MAFLKKNDNETAYVGGRKHFTDVIKNSGPAEALIWRQPEEDFNTKSTLIVNPGEEAIFIKGGTVEQTFENGTYRLSTENYPFISRLRNAFSGGISTFNCLVYFVNKAHSMEIKWGTDTPIQVRDKAHGILTNAKVRGVYKVRVDNSVLFLEKMVGSRTPMVGQDLSSYFLGEFRGKIKSAVSKFLNGLTQELIGLDAYMDELSEQISPVIDETLKPYGLRCVNFSFAGLDIDTSKYDALDEFNIEATRRMRMAQGDQMAFEVLGDNWGKLQSAEILKEVAKNPGAGGMAAAGAGLGMGMAAGSVFNSMAQEMFKPVNKTNNQSAQPFEQHSSGRFVQQTRAQRGDTAQQNAQTAQHRSERFVQQAQMQQSVPVQQPQSEDDPLETLAKLKKMLDMGLIEQSEYDIKKTEILSRM